MRASVRTMTASLETMRASVRAMTASVQVTGASVQVMRAPVQTMRASSVTMAASVQTMRASFQPMTASLRTMTAYKAIIARIGKNGVLHLPRASHRSKCPHRSHLHDEAKEKVAPGCPPMPLPRDLPLRAGLCVGPYAATSWASSVVDWLLFALGTKRCFMSSFCSWSLVSPAGVLSMA